MDTLTLDNNECVETLVASLREGEGARCIKQLDIEGYHCDSEAEVNTLRKLRRLVQGTLNIRVLGLGYSAMTAGVWRGLAGVVDTGGVTIGRVVTERRDVREGRDEDVLKLWGVTRQRWWVGGKTFQKTEPFTNMWNYVQG